MARDTLVAEGGRSVMLRGETIAQIDELADVVDLASHRGVRKGQPDRAGVIAAVVALVLEHADLRQRLSDRVAPIVEELRRREEDKLARRERSGGRRGRPRVPELKANEESRRRRSGGKRGRPPGPNTVPDLYADATPDAPSGRRER